MALAVYAFFWYFVGQILSLKNAKYHVLMFTILMTALVCEIAASIFLIVLQAQLEREAQLSEQMIRMYRASLVSGDLYWLFSVLAHTIFATALWRLSLRFLAALKVGPEDSSTRVKVCFIVQCIAIVICFCLLLWVNWDSS